MLQERAVDLTIPNGGGLYTTLHIYVWEFGLNANAVKMVVGCGMDVSRLAVVTHLFYIARERRLWWTYIFSTHLVEAGANIDVLLPALRRGAALGRHDLL